MSKTPPEYYRFVKIYKNGGITVYPGVSLKGDFINQDGKITLKASSIFIDIPKEYLESHTPKQLEKKTRKK